MTMHDPGDADRYHLELVVEAGRHGCSLAPRDQMLIGGLPGYGEPAREVRLPLVPGLRRSAATTRYTLTWSEDRRKAAGVRSSGPASLSTTRGSAEARYVTEIARSAR